MFIAILDLRTAPADRSAVLAQLDAEGPVVRAMAGCRGFRIFVPRTEATDVTVLHEWVDEASFRGYLVSEAFARSSAVLRPLLIEPPTSRRFEARLVETAA